MTRLENQKTWDAIMTESIKYFSCLIPYMVHKGFLSFMWYILPRDVHMKTESLLHYVNRAVYFLQLPAANCFNKHTCNCSHLYKEKSIKMLKLSP